MNLVLDKTDINGLGLQEMNPDYIRLIDDKGKINSKTKRIYLSPDDSQSLSFAMNSDTKEWVFGSDYDFGLIHIHTSTLYTYDPESDMEDEPRFEMEYFGRFWKNDKIIIFWDYPNSNEFINFINKLGKRLNKSIWNNNWKIIITDKNGYVSDMVNVEDYKGSGDFSEEERQLHLMNAKEKTKRLKNMGYKSKIKKWKEWQKPFENKLNESPDNIMVKGEKIKYTTSECIPFIIYKNMNNNIEFWAGDYGQGHSRKGKKHLYEGRVWVEERIMSFWTYPTKEEFFKYLPHIEKEINMKHKDKYIKFLRNGWKIEIVLDNNSKNMKIGDINSGRYNKDTTGWNDEEYEQNEFFIPIEDYGGSVDFSEEEKILHLMTPAEKSKRLKEMGYKSKISKWKKYQKPFENKIEKFKNFISK